MVLALELCLLIATAWFLETTGRPNKSERWDVLMFLLLVSVLGVLAMLSQSVRLVAIRAALRAPSPRAAGVAAAAPLVRDRLPPEQARRCRRSSRGRSR
ncbi:MAG: hypothetical protein U1E76_21745 [Planctomycetota bacterium]